MTDILSPGLDRELFGDVDLDLHRAFNMYDMADPEATSGGPILPTTEPINHYSATNIETVTLADIERFDELHGTEWAMISAPESADDLPGDLVGASPTGEDECAEVPHDDICNWPCADPGKDPGGLQDTSWVTPPPSDSPDCFWASSGGEMSAVQQAVEVPQGTPSMEALMAENARLKALLESQNASLTPVETEGPPKTPPKKATQPKTPQSTPRKMSVNRNVSRSPIAKKPRALTGAALALSQQKGPIETLWGASYSPENSHATQMPAPSVHPSPQIQMTPSTQPTSAIAHGDPVSAQIDEFPALCQQPLQISPVKLDFFTELGQTESSSQFAPTSSHQSQVVNADNSLGYTGSETAHDDTELSLENAILLRDLMAGASQYDEEVLSQEAPPIQASSLPMPSSMTPEPASYQLPQSSRRQSFPQHLQGGQIQYGGFTFAPASNNGTNAVYPEHPTPSPAAISKISTPTSKATPKSKAATKAKTPKRTPAKRTPSSTTKANKVTKKTHQRNASAPTPVARARQRSIQELYAAKFVTLSLDEKARLLLPLLQGLDPITGLRTGRPGTLLASESSAVAQGSSSVSDSPAPPATDMIGNNGNDMGLGDWNFDIDTNDLGFDIDTGIATNNNIIAANDDGFNMNANDLGFDIDSSIDLANIDFGANDLASNMSTGSADVPSTNNLNTNTINMVQQAAAELNDEYCMNRQNEALERAVMLQAAGRRR
ncbi:Nn.00g070320.m01.CDS01 [Neocucurbitaria sp. VM-36]